MTEDPRAGAAIVILAGPPCAGKTSYATAHARPGDEVLDWDVVFAEISGRPLYEQTARHARQVSLEFERRRRELGRGWIIRSAPRYVDRARLTREHRARSIVLAVAPLECATRLALSGRPGPVQMRQHLYIYDWWRQFTHVPSPDEVVLRVGAAESDAHGATRDDLEVTV